MLAAWHQPGAPAGLRFPFGAHAFCREAADKLLRQEADLAARVRTPEAGWLPAHRIHEVAAQYVLPEQVVAFTRAIERAIAEVRS